MLETVLVTGATGFLGAAVIENLLATTDANVYALVRESDGRKPDERLESLWCERASLHAHLGSRVIAIAGDIERERLGMTVDAYDELARSIDAIVHTAAEVGVNETRERFWSANVVGTFNVAQLARRAVQLGGLKRFVHVSTAYVAGRRTGAVPEELFAEGAFNSLYEWSKHEAELLVSSYDDVPFAIVRPSQIVGDSRDGFISTFNTLYYPLKVYLRGGLRVVPASREMRVNMVPVDYVARIVCRAIGDERARGRVLHAVIAHEDQPKLGELIDAVREWARENLRVELPRPVHLPAAGLAAIGRARNLSSSSAPKRRSLVRNFMALSPYFAEDRVFECERGRAVAGCAPTSWRRFLPRMLEYATRHGFLNRTGRTVYEQILMRLRDGASTRIDYYDVSRDGFEKHDGREVRAEICSIAQALIAHGVEVGTRVATIGLNSVRYFALDAAIGLVGAVNVPIYYTSPASDVYDLVEASGARMLFVGTSRMLEALDPARLNAEVIAFGAGEGGGGGEGEGGADEGGGTGDSDGSGTGGSSDGAEDHGRAGITAWSTFIAAGKHLDMPLPWVSPTSTATIRYTSGTTGAPKGVVFDQQQVRWMGEVMPAVLDWRTRTSRKVRYLSFLPMSHVVEGILVAYAPYYILADVEMYYLTDFPALADVLPKVRPNLFFSVPRFYEKVWNQFADSAPGRFWIALPEGPAKRALAYPLRFVVLRRAGLDRCRQLIVGSAPMGLELFESYRSLGIEIHNAFGVTEAPLITLSRLGDNELGSVGALLPDTQARIGDDGQVYIRGPQVTRGYDGVREPTLDEDGWFCTGDMGEWSARGNLVLNGRMKEILVTSYGKNIAPQKIEVLLKGIDGVAEALVIADARPFTTALVWLEDEQGEGFDFERLDRAVRAINDQLSHPEQVKRWIVCARPLTVAAGELTPNLKVRRNNVIEARADVVEALYDSWGSEPHDVLHRGSAS